MAELDKVFWIVAGMTEKVGHEHGKEQTDGDSKKIYQRCIRTYKLSLQRMESLRMSWREALSVWRDAQRALLELHGLHTFLKEVVPRIDSDVDFSSKILNVRGAFTTQSDTAYHLYRIGIPVWFICGNRQFKGKVYEIQKPIPWKRFLSPEVMKFKGRPILDGLLFRLDAHMREESVNHFMGENHIRGLLDKIYEFQKGDLSVTRNLKRRRSQSPPPSLVMAPVRNPKTGKSGNASGSNCSAKENSGNKQSQEADAKSSKHSRVPKLKSEPNVNHARVLHIPDSIGGQPDLPAYHPVVRQCLESIAPIPDDRSHPALYPLPPPFLLIHQDEDKTAELYLNYIRIRPALIDMIIETSYFDRCVWRKMRNWRVILHGDYAKSTPLAPNTTCPFVKKNYDRMPEASSSRRRDHKHEPQDTPLAKRQRVADIATIKVVLHAERHLDLFDKTQEQIWRHKKVSTEMIKKDRSLRMEVQWELCELLFRCEFYALDYVVVPRENMTDAEIHQRNVTISRIFNRNVYFRGRNLREAVVPDLDFQFEYWDEPVCFDNENISLLQSILSTWPGYKDHVADFRYLITFYAETFVEYFKRMPTLHCKTPEMIQYNYKRR